MIFINRVIVTGATGFIGQWLVDELLRRNIEVVVVVRNAGRLKPDWLKNKRFEFIEKNFLDLTAEDFTKKSNSNYDVWFNLAWNGVGVNFKDNYKVQVLNLDISIHLFKLCSAISCDKFVASGTVAEYVFSPDIMNFDEMQTPNDMYGATKVALHYYLGVLSRQMGQPYVWAIIPSTFGEYRNDSNIITYTIRKLLKGEKPIYGNLEQLWDFLYVADVVNALIVIAEKCQFDGQTYGIGSGIYKKLKEYICEIRDCIDPSLPLGIGENPIMNTKTFSSCVNIERLVNDTGFSPKVSFADGIKKTIEYMKMKIDKIS